MGGVEMHDLRVRPDAVHQSGTFFGNDPVMAALPADEPFVLLGESFSGPLALMAASKPALVCGPDELAAVSAERSSIFPSRL